MVVRTRSRSLTTKAIEISLAVPQVVAHRVTRMALAGPVPSDRDRREFKLMIDEKHSAFVQAWSNMSIQALRANQAIAASMLRSLLRPWTVASAASVAAQVQASMVDVLSTGLAPVHRKAMANARRLSKTTFR
jgi:hypothetical protein